MRYVFIQARSLSLPTGRHGGIIEARYRLADDTGHPPRGTTRISERMRVLTDPYRIAGRFRTGPGDAQNGMFNDRYALVSPDPLPDDFRFEVEQTYEANGESLIGKNKIVYTPDAVMLYVEDRGRLKLCGRGTTDR